MSLIRKGDVKNHLSVLGHARRHLHLSVSRPDATGFSVAEPDENQIEPSGFIEDFIAEHSPRGISSAPVAPLPEPTGIQVPGVPRNLQK